MVSTSPAIRRASSVFTWLAVAVLSVHSASAATYFVNPTLGNDGSLGTQTLPWKSLSKAAASAKAGDSVLVMPGTYVDPAADPFHAFNPASSGAPGAPIVFKSYQRHAAILASANKNFPAMGVNARKYIVIDGFRVQGGIGLRESSDNGVIRNCDVTGGFIQSGDVSLHWGIYLSGVAQSVVEHNYIHAPNPIGNKTHNGAGVMVIGVPAVCDGNLIQNNEADGGGGVWYNAFGQKAGLISNNTWKRNVARNATAGFMGMGSTDNTKFAVANRFQENLIVNCKSAFELDHYCTGFLIHGNTAFNCQIFLNGGYRTDAEAKITGTELWNNVFSGPTGGAFFRRDAKVVDWKVFLAFSDYNIIRGSPAVWNYSQSMASLAEWRSATSLDPHSISNDPQFANIAVGDFRLGTGSPAIHAGCDRKGTTGYDGRPPDVGAFPQGPTAAVLGFAWRLPGGRRQPAAPANLGARAYDPIPD